MTTWNYRVILKDGLYQVREVFYDETGKIIACSGEAIELVGETLEELQEMLAWFQEALQDPVVLPENLPASSQKPKAKKSGISLQALREKLALEPSGNG